MSSRKTAGRRGTNKKRAQRATSNVFAMFDQAQIAEFKEAFNMIDQNRDGFVDKDDLHDMLASLGKTRIIIFYSYLKAPHGWAKVSTVYVSPLHAYKYIIFPARWFSLFEVYKAWKKNDN